MAIFKDKTGKEWTIEVTVGAIRRVESLIGVNLAKIDRPRSADSVTPLLADLTVDLALQVDVIYAIAKPQADAAGVTDEGFAEALDGVAFHDASVAFWSALERFFRQSRPDLAAAIKKRTEAMTAAMERAIKDVEAIDTSTLGRPASSLPASSGSTPPH